MNYGQDSVIGSNSKYAGPEAVPMREPQVMSEVVRLHQSIENLGKGIEGLTQRLSGVVRSEPPSATAAPISEVLVPIADQIAGARMHVQGLSNAVDSLLQRLEI